MLPQWYPPTHSLKLAIAILCKVDHNGDDESRPLWDPDYTRVSPRGVKDPPRNRVIGRQGVSRDVKGEPASGYNSTSCVGASRYNSTSWLGVQGARRGNSTSWCGALGQTRSSEKRDHTETYSPEAHNLDQATTNLNWEREKETTVWSRLLTERQLRDPWRYRDVERRRSNAALPLEYAKKIGASPHLFFCTWNRACGTSDAESLTKQSISIRVVNGQEESVNQKCIRVKQLLRVYCLKLWDNHVGFWGSFARNGERIWDFCFPFYYVPCV